MSRDECAAATPSKRERQFFQGGMLLGALVGWVITLAVLGLTGAIR